ncbi:hypothetical protein DE146DRAFT_126544 [Phaeosphaeria sp. MPI-PUGE-AT-0046c]|nr:hypothetical protein DE146DRAFT_126544 [Phaeosphaeria sp. MPI-PUGE-AT-0046c]
MVWPFGIFGSKAVAPERVPTDEVIPLFERDDTATNKGISLEFSMIFDEVLDADKLSGALWKLLEKPGWRKLGARLRYNDKGKLDYHVPAQYTKERPPFNYTHLVETKPFSQHRIGANFPTLTGKVQVLDALGHARVLTDEESTKKSLEDWTLHDVGQLGLHILSFPDTTVVSITWLHTLLDAMGRHALLLAWRAVLDGRDNDVPPFVGYDSDPLAKLGTSSTALKEVSMKPYLLSKLGMLRFVSNMVYELYWYPTEEGRMLIVPAAEFSKIKAEAFADLDSLSPDKITYTTTEPRKPFLSDGDIGTAWFMRLYARSNPEIANSYPQRLISVMNVMGMRDIVRSSEPKLLPPAHEGAYIHNCITASFTIMPISDFLSLPLGHVAARIRSDLVTQSSRPHLEASQRDAAGGKTVLYGSGDMVLVTLTNWAKAKLYETDFGAARKDGGQGKAVPRFIQPWAVTPSLPLRGSGNCVGKDKHGNWQFGVLMKKELIDGFVREVERIGGERS